jgi:hypothetical protein
VTGPEHYQAAEALLDDPQEHGKAAGWPISDVLARAQVHAMLAVAASLGLSADMARPDQEAWQQIAASEFKA